jgi:hypothetical protein
MKKTSKIIETRVPEFRYSGFKRVYVSPADIDKSKKVGFDGDIIGVASIHEIMDLVF